MGAIIKPIIVFPYNNPFSKKNTKPVVLASLGHITCSELIKYITVITPFTKDVNDICDTIVVKQEIKKNNYHIEVIKLIEKINPSSIEVHQDIKLATKIAKFYPNISVALIKHNEFLVNRFREKFIPYKLYYEYKYLKYIDRVFCISKYVQKSLIEKYCKYEKKFVLLYNSYAHLKIAENIDLSFKENNIIFIGKPVKKKGIVELFDAIPDILSRNPQYCIVIVSGIFSKKNKYKSYLQSYFNNDIYKSYINTKRILLYSNLSSSEIYDLLLKAKIALVTTKTPEPFGLVALEYHLAKCLVISSGSGGLGEITLDNGIYLNSVSKENINMAVNQAIDNYQKYIEIINNGYEYVRDEFNMEKIVKIIDDYRIKNGK